MEFLVVQELLGDVRDFLLGGSSEFSWGRVLGRGPGLGTKEERPPLTPRGLNARRAAPAPLGSLL